MKIKIWTVYIKTKVRVTPIITAKWNTVTKIILKSDLYWIYDLRLLKKKKINRNGSRAHAHTRMHTHTLPLPHVGCADPFWSVSHSKFIGSVDLGNIDMSDVWNLSCCFT